MFDQPGVTTGFPISVYYDAQQAIDAGHVYRAPETKSAKIERAVIVLNGTVSGNSTVDLVIKDESGNQFVVMVTGNLLGGVTAIACK